MKKIAPTKDIRALLPVAEITTQWDRFRREANLRTWCFAWAVMAACGWLTAAALFFFSL